MSYSGDLYVKEKQSLIVAISGETTALTVATALTTFRMPFNFQLSDVKASLTTAGGTSGTTTIDINSDGSSILSTKLTIDDGDLTSVGATTKYVFSKTQILANSKMTVDVDAITGSGAEAGGKITLIGYPLS